jgi:hypothetical protein
MSTDNFIQLTSLINKSVGIISLTNENIDISSEPNKTITIGSSIYADEVAEVLRYGETPTTTKVVGERYQVIKPPKQRV